MALPTSGELSLNDVYFELTGYNMPVNSDITLEDLCTGVVEPLNTNSPNQPTTSAPFDILSWYGYDHSATGGSAASMDPYYDDNSTSVCRMTCGTLTIYYGDTGMRIETVADLAANLVDIYLDSGLTFLAKPGYFGGPSKVSDAFYWNGSTWGSSVAC